MPLVAPEFLNAWLPSGRRAATLVKVELTDPSALTLHLSNIEVSTPGSPPLLWPAALSDIGPVEEPGNLGSYDPGLATFDFELSSRPLRGQVPGDSALKLLASYYWYGATVTAYYWELSMTDFTKAAQIFKGVVIDIETDSNRGIIYCQQSNSWIKRVPLDEVTRAKFPRTAERSVGLPIPIDYGSLLTPEARGPASPYGVFQQGITSVAGLRRAGVRGVVTKVGKGNAGEKGQVLFAGHPCKTFHSDVAGATPAIELGSRLAEIDPIAGDVINGAAGTGFNIADITSAGVQPFDVYYPILVVDNQLAAASNADGPRAATDPFNETSYAVLDYDAGQREIRLPLPDTAPVGSWLDTYIVLGYSTNAGAGLVLQMDNPTTGGAAFVLPPASTTRTVQSMTVPKTGGHPLPGNRWNMGTDGCYISIYFNGVQTGKTARIYYAGAAIRCRPDWPIATPASVQDVPITNEPVRISNILDTYYQAYASTVRPVIEIPAKSRVDSQFYATLEGWADDGSGTDTGTPNALIERPPDVLRHFLRTYCDETLFQDAGGEPGSLTDLRAHLKTWRATDMKAAFGLDEFRQSSDVVRNLSRSSLCWFFKSCFTNKWSGIPWKLGRAVDFPRRLTRYDLLEPAGPKIILHRDDVQNDVAIEYGRDAWSRRLIHETFVGPSRSGSGHRYRLLRDESATIVASNSDRIDFSDAYGSHTANLTAGSYSMADLIAHVRTQVDGATTSLAHVSWGLKIIAGYNDKLYINDGAIKNATIPAGDYSADPASLATAIQTALNGVSSNWTCTYSASTRKFTIDRSSGTKTLLWASIGANSAGPALGYRWADFAAPATSDYSVESEQLTISVLDADGPLILKWETGTNGIDAATPRAAGGLLAFDMARDYAEGTSWAIAQSPKNSREADCDTSVKRYGWRPQLKLGLEYVNDTDTAREIRNRVAALWKQPPVEIQFASERVPDLQRGMVFDFDASLDEVKPFTAPGSDGSWLGKNFVAVRCRRHSMPTPHQSVVAFLVPAA